MAAPQLEGGGIEEGWRLKKVASKIAKGTASALKQPKENVSLSQDTGLVTPRQVNNFPRASPSSTGDASALERVVGDYRQRILKLEIDIEELKVDVKTLTSDKNKLLLNFANIQAQYGKAVGRLQIFEQFHREAQAASTGKSVDQSGNITSLESSSFLWGCLISTNSLTKKKM